MTLLELLGLLVSQVVEIRHGSILRMGEAPPAVAPRESRMP
jgi:hypothetical protein